MLTPHPETTSLSTPHVLTPHPVAGETASLHSIYHMCSLHAMFGRQLHSLCPVLTPSMLARLGDNFTQYATCIDSTACWETTSQLTFRLDNGLSKLDYLISECHIGWPLRSYWDWVVYLVGYTVRLLRLYIITERFSQNEAIHVAIKAAQAHSHSNQCAQLYQHFILRRSINMFQYSVVVATAALIACSFMHLASAQTAPRMLILYSYIKLMLKFYCAR